MSCGQWSVERAAVVVAVTWSTNECDYFLDDLCSGVESAHAQFCRARKTHSSSQKGSLLKLSYSCLCVKNMRVLHTAQLAMYLDDKLLFVPPLPALPLPVLPLPVLPGVGLAMSRP